MNSLRTPMRVLAAVFALALFGTACAGNDPTELAEGTASAVDEPATSAPEPDPTDTRSSSSESGTTEAGTTAPSGSTGLPGSLTEAEVLVVTGSDPIGASGEVRGEISQSGEIDTYTFTMAAGQAVLIEQLGGCDIQNGDSFFGDVSGVGVNGAIVFRQGCDGNERFEASSDGPVTIEIRDLDEAATGTYAFRIVDVTPGASIALTNGQEVRPDSPAGAGRLERAGYRDIYTFSVTDDQPFTITQLGCEFVGGDSLWLDVDGAGLSSTVFFKDNDCAAVDRFEPEGNGVVTLTARNSDDKLTGDYAFRVDTLVEGSTNEITPGDASDPAATEIISGELSVPGEQDVYVFQVEEGQQFLIQQAGGCDFAGTDQVWMDIEGAGVNSVSFFDELSDGDCLDHDWFNPDENGQITLTARDSDSAGTGQYNFRVLWVPIDPIVTLTSGDVVSPGVPTEGAGVLDAVGQQDVYRFDVLDDQRFVIEQLGDCDFTGDDQTILEIDGAGVNSVMFFEEQSEGDCLRVEEFEPKEAGPVLLTLLSRSNQVTGEYSFRVRLVADTE